MHIGRRDTVRGSHDRPDGDPDGIRTRVTGRDPATDTIADDLGRPNRST
jgi:hypothetical protein